MSWDRCLDLLLVSQSALCGWNQCCQWRAGVWWPGQPLGLMQWLPWLCWLTRCLQCLLRYSRHLGVGRKSVLSSVLSSLPTWTRQAWVAQNLWEAFPVVWVSSILSSFSPEDFCISAGLGWCVCGMGGLVSLFGLVLMYLAESCELRRPLSQNPQDRWVDSFSGMTFSIACIYLLPAPEKNSRTSAWAVSFRGGKQEKMAENHA